MNQKHRLMTVLLSPRVTEKSTRLGEAGRQFAFKVERSATKPQIKRAVELMFNVKVEGVRVNNVRGKHKMFRAKEGRRAGWKKAYVKLAEGFEIDFAST
ncbi:MAG: 50S ribosomal protein L23 [Gammaproteobacteria bacterium]|nr:50S ribosomal protein L23 [Gammaproteobacteria bacterium]